MALPPLPDEAIVLGSLAPDWRSAVAVAGAALTSSGAARPGYSDEMIRMIDEHGPYVVIAPGLALAHARPDDQVISDGLAVVTLASPVSFGHPHNDPVRVIVGLAVESVGGHLDLIADIANVFNDQSRIGALADATRADDVRAIMGVGAGSGSSSGGSAPGSSSGGSASGSPSEGGS
ncbi:MULTISPECIES: PTS sugar transporter subunit IIA [unclassified Frondihabitans]|uniref:PTS sugar transporter subunit IIA n=1 Tax=unclassified Frondihabitans TaxID=2626248 RepID=UPI000F50845D|nr:MULTISPECIES: PTS sugar transporter subunit IIA [unclassified Frondihabitans]RPE79017.1 PTS system IIA component (L-Asc family) [Frondihabitans sp. PhB153]RPF09297.1 PTS system IIA component (L-Asc family) [Frondihabitans sp. PhB161]